MKITIDKTDENGEQNVDIHIDEWDTWSLHNSLAKIIHPALIKFKEERQKMPGIPLMFFKENAATTKNGNYTEEATEEAEQLFLDSLDKMIYAMNEIANEYPEEETYFKFKDTDRTFGVTSIDTEGLQNYQKRIQEGCELFGKYFSGLWW